MAFNVWFIIWPNQKKALGIVQVEAAEKSQGRPHGDADLAHQHHALDPDALLHGRAAERRPVSSTAGHEREGAPWGPFCFAVAAPQRGGGALSSPPIFAPALMPFWANQP